MNALRHRLRRPRRRSRRRTTGGRCGVVEGHGRRRGRRATRSLRLTHRQRQALGRGHRVARLAPPAADENSCLGQRLLAHRVGPPPAGGRGEGHGRPALELAAGHRAARSAGPRPSQSAPAMAASSGRMTGGHRGQGTRPPARAAYRARPTVRTGRVPDEQGRCQRRGLPNLSRNSAERSPHRRDSTSSPRHLVGRSWQRSFPMLRRLSVPRPASAPGPASASTPPPTTRSW